MSIQTDPQVGVPADLLEAIRAFPHERTVEHCGRRWTVSPFDIYANCPNCGARIKLRSFAAVPEIEDVFDAIFEWMLQPGADTVVRRRQQEIEADAAE